MIFGLNPLLLAAGPEIPILRDILVICVLAIAITFICHKLKVPVIVGLLATGVLAGPHGLSLVNSEEGVEMLAEVGVVLLLFSIGIEFSLKSLLKIKKLVLFGGTLQVVLTIAACYGVFLALGRTAEEAVFVGFIVALSSTTIVLKVLQERAEVDSPQGKSALGILIFQDIAVVPMMLLIPVLAGVEKSTDESTLMLIAKVLGIALLVVVGARWIVPALFYQIARTRNREIFILAVVAMCLLVAHVTQMAGLSFALGAFISGLIISESEYSHQALGNILPFRDVFTSFFFISIGMLLDASYLLEEPLLIALFVLGAFLLKAIIATLSLVILRLPLRSAVIAGLSIGQIGEFSFLLAKIGVDDKLLPESYYQLFLSCTIMTMAASPFVMKLAPKLADAMARLPLPKRLIEGSISISSQPAFEGENHLVIIGYGVNGRNLVRTAKGAAIPFVVIEMNAETVSGERKRGVPIFYGDATNDAILHHVNVHSAKVVVIGINDPPATRRVTELVRRMAHGAHVIVRTQYLAELEALYKLGANEVIPTEFETSIEIFARVLAKYLVPKADIEKVIAEIREGGYEMLRSISDSASAETDIKVVMPGIEISSMRVEAGSEWADKTPAEIGMRKDFGVTLLAIKRGDGIISHPDAEEKMLAGDVAFVLGLPEKMRAASDRFSPRGDVEPEGAAQT
ncbi:MAG: cation:proton antiporter [Planctomycetes bacterium]|nr:cation:proton antiporter [Planctomycetota bacterium]